MNKITKVSRQRGDTYQCALCGKDYILGHHLQRSCSNECSKNLRKQTQKKYRDKNKQATKKRQAKWFQANKEGIRIRRQEYMRAYYHRKKAEKLAVVSEGEL